MSQTIISVENLSKAYWLGMKEKTHDTLTGAVKSLAMAPLRNFHKLRRVDTFSRNGNDADAQKQNGPEEDDILWALNAVSFEVAEGEVVGIIGRNGAGKSTLLKVLSRITEPTSGRAVIRGRVSSLLEVGTGFHPELTGRDNIYMNGTILGMTKREIDRKFDEIVDFSGVENFLDTPVKRYSSGMQVRLAFAVAAHLEPEILIVDEVLAVGDAEFQKKCMGKMQDVAQGGRTVLFVSHNMAAVQGLCGRGFVLQNGEQVFDGDSRQAVERYFSGNAATGGISTRNPCDLADRRNPYDPGNLYIRGISLADGQGRECESFATGRPLQIRIELKDANSLRSSQIGVIFKSNAEQWLGIINTGMCPPRKFEDASNQVAILSIPRLPFVPGVYWIDLSLAIKSVGRIDYVERAVRLDVCEYDVYGSGYTVKDRDGIVYIDGSWEVLCYDSGENDKSLNEVDGITNG